MVDFSTSRRGFLKGAVATTALGIFGQLSLNEILAGTPDELIPELDEALFRELALRAVDAARSAGASFADVRVAGSRMIRSQFASGYADLGIGPWTQYLYVPELVFEAEYGIRALVDGAWGFAGGTILTPEGVRDTALLAVRRARGNKPRRPRTIELAPAPVVDDGRWETPIEQDPFQVPFREQLEYGFELTDAVQRVLPKRYEPAAGGFLLFVSSLRVFASTDGSLITQRLFNARPNLKIHVRASESSPRRNLEVPEILTGPYGYEAVTRNDIMRGITETAERALESSRRTPVTPTPVDVGRYDLVLSGSVMGQILAKTIGQALNLERVLGYRANHEGTSFAAPPAETLDSYEIGSPLITVTADRSRPGGSATVGWDDEGVPTGERTLVREGVIIDYLNTRQTAGELAGLYRERGLVEGAGGFASGVGLQVPTVRLPNITMVPGQEEIGVDDMIRDIKRGFYVGECGVSSDQQVISFQGYGLGDGSIREIRDGKLGDPVSGFAFEALTSTFWKGIDAIGGSESVVEGENMTGYLVVFGPSQTSYAQSRSVPARARDVNVINTGRLL